METELNFYHKLLDVFLNLDKRTLFNHFLFMIMSTFGLIMLSYSNFYIWHNTTELFSASIAFGIFIVSSNTYKITKNDFFMLLGIGYLFIGVLDLFHTFSYSDMNIFPNASLKLVSQFWIAARVVELGTVLSSTIFLHKKTIKPNYFFIYALYLVLFAFLVVSIMYTEIIPAFRIEGEGITQFKIVTEYFISLGFFISIAIFYKFRKLIDKSVFIYMEISLILKAISEIFFTLFISNTDMAFIIGHIFKVISFYHMYEGIIVNGLQRPFDILIDNLDKADSSLKEKEKQHRYMEKIILKNEQCYDLIINNSGDAIVVIVGEKIAFANSTAVKTLGGNSISDIVGKELCEFVHKDSIHELKNKIDTLIKNRNSYDFCESDIKCLDGNMLDAEGSVNSIVYRRKPALLIILNDVKHQQKIKSLKSDVIEKENKLNESNEHNMALMEFFSNISHELKTPLNIILGSIQLLQSGDEKQNPCDEKLNKLLIIMKQNTYRLVRLVNNIIDTSKFDTGYLKLNTNNRNIVSIVEDITFSVIDYYGKYKGISIIFDTDTEEKIMAVDVDKIERIMLNLLSNAIKFTDKGGKVYVTVKDEGEHVLISVKDTGIGIPEEKLDVIFDRFGQVDKTFTRNREGSGIGLSLVKALTEIQGGSISVISKIGEGSEFIVKLPAVLNENEETDYSITYENKVDKINIEFSDIYDNR